MAVKKEFGTIYEDKIPFNDCEMLFVNNYNELNNKEVIFKKMMDRNDYVI
jgi:hypothetical protein